MTADGLLPPAFVDPGTIVQLVSTYDATIDHFGGVKDRQPCCMSYGIITFMSCGSMNVHYTASHSVTPTISSHNL